MKQAVANGLRTRAIYTVNVDNASDISNALDLADKIGLEVLSFHYFTPTGIGRNCPELQLSPDRWIKFSDQLRQEAPRRRVRIFYPPAFVDELRMKELRLQGYRGCTARNLERLAILPDRRVYICSAFFDTDLHFGTFENGHVVPRCSVDRGSELNLVNEISANCTKCPNASTCRAGCAAYDYFDRTRPTSLCDRRTVPVCPLWSVPALPDSTQPRLKDLR